MKKSERQIDMLSKRLSIVDRITVADGAELLGVTESSVRRIYAKMESAGLAIRVHGGIAKLVSETSQYNYAVEASTNIALKKKIASAVAKIVLEHKNVYLDSGSTLYEVSLAISNILARKPDLSTKIFTNSLKNLEVLQGLVTIRLSGGDYRRARRDFCGFIAESAVSNLNFDVCVVGADGISSTGFLGTTDFETAKLCTCAMSHSEIRILAVDSTKFGKTAYVNYADIGEISVIVTDSGISEETKDYLTKKGIKLVIV